MSLVARMASGAVMLCLAMAGCANGVLPSGADGDVRLEGVIAATDLAPWTWDGDAVVELDTAQGRVAVRLPARWNLCSAAQVDVHALTVGAQVLAVGERDGEGDLVVCRGPAHRLVPRP